MMRAIAWLASAVVAILLLCFLVLQVLPWVVWFLPVILVPLAAMASFAALNAVRKRGNHGAVTVQPTAPAIERTPFAFGLILGLGAALTWPWAKFLDQVIGPQLPRVLQSLLLPQFGYREPVAGGRFYYDGITMADFRGYLLLATVFGCICVCVTTVCLIAERIFGRRLLD